MLILKILFNEDHSLGYRLISVPISFISHYLGSWVLAISFILLFALASVPTIWIFEDNVFGTPFQETLRYIPTIVDGNAFIQADIWQKFIYLNEIAWKSFLHFNWYYKLSIVVGCFYPFAHFFLGFKSADDDN